MKKEKRFTQFSDWHSQDVEEKLNYSFVENHPALLNWIRPQETETLPFEPFIAFLRQRLLRRQIAWNEAELNMEFIGPLLATIDYSGTRFSSFAERTIAATVQGYYVQGMVDYLVASGSYEPEHPYFFIHEYKRFKGSEADPLGQLLIAMIAAKHINNDARPIYGCFVVAAIWRFVVLLNGQEYAVSKAYDASDEDGLREIWNILNHTKSIIEERIQANAPLV